MLRARDNPFSSDRVLRLRYRLSDEEWYGLYRKLERQGGRGALVGPKGSGKTTLLEDLSLRLRQRVKDVTLIRLSAEFPALPNQYKTTFFTGLTRNHAVLLDGAEQLPFMRWMQFRWQTRQAGIVVITTHWAGRLPTLHPCSTSSGLLRELVASLGQTVSETNATALFHRHNGNLREALRELYDLAADKDFPAVSRPSPRDQGYCPSG